MHTVVLEVLIVRLHSHRLDTLGDEVTDRIVNHGACHAGLQTEAIGKVCRHVELTPADMDVAVGGLPEGNGAWVEAVNECAKGQEVQCAIFANIKAHVWLVVRVVA